MESARVKSDPRGYGSHGGLNALKIHGLKYWLTKLGFPQSILHIERIDGRNAVFLRVVVEGIPCDIAAGWLDLLHRERDPDRLARARILEYVLLQRVIAVA